jgi:hypothetical protein
MKPMKNRLDASAMLALFALAGCGGDRHPVGIDLTPASSPSAQLQREVVTENNVFFENPCTGEVIALDITSQTLYFTREDPAGGLLYWIHINTLRSTGVGEETGAVYQFHVSNRAQVRMRVSPQGEGQAIELFRANAVVTAPGQERFLVHMVFVVTANALGEVSTRIDRFEAHCR